MVHKIIRIGNSHGIIFRNYLTRYLFNDYNDKFNPIGKKCFIRLNNDGNLEVKASHENDAIAIKKINTSFYLPLNLCYIKELFGKEIKHNTTKKFLVDINMNEYKENMHIDSQFINDRKLIIIAIKER